MHGVAGLKEEKLQRYSNDFQLSILKRMREEQLSYRQTPALFDIRKFDIIGLWERRFDEGGFDVLTKQPKRAGRPKKKCRPPFLLFNPPQPMTNRAHAMICLPR